MKPCAVYGVGIGIDGREAAIQASQRALDQIGTSRPVLGLVFVAQEFDITDVLAGLSALLGDTPLWGFSTTCPLTTEGDQPRSVVVALFTGAELKAQVDWYPNYAQDSSSVARQLVQRLMQGVFLPQEILLAADGIDGSLAPICAALADLRVRVCGCMAAGEPSRGKTFAIGRNQAGPGALSAAILSGRFRLGVGLAHGWKDLGVYFRATRSSDVWVQELDGAPAAVVYAGYFGYTARDWAFPPLTGMARLYPLGIEPPHSKDTAPFVELDARSLLIRSALRVEVDGSLRMSAPVPAGSVVHLLAGDPDACLDAAREAAGAALAGLDGAKPLLAMALVDTAWRLLLEARPGQLSAALNEALGGIPLAGAYTYGQLARPALDKPPVLHNQNLEVLVFGEEQG